MNYAAANYIYTSTSTDTPRVRELYLLRKYLGPLPPRKAAAVAPTASNSANLLVREIGQTLASNEPPQDSLPDRAGTPEPLADVEPAAEPSVDLGAATVSEMTSRLTTTGVLHRALERSLAALLEGARDERFQDGMDSNLGVGLRVLFRNYATDFVPVLDEQLERRDISARILAEVFYTLGQINDETTKGWRFATLVRFLKSPSPNVRDAAATGLAYLDDKSAVPYLREAIERESSESFREDLRAVVEQLSA